MRSRVAEELRHELTADVSKMTVDERLELAFRLGDEAVADYASANGVDEATALRVLTRQRHAGRRRSRCHEGLDD
jgi:hypothetical protein